MILQKYKTKQKYEQKYEMLPFYNIWRLFDIFKYYCIMTRKRNDIHDFKKSSINTYIFKFKEKYKRI